MNHGGDHHQKQQQQEFFVYFLHVSSKLRSRALPECHGTWRKTRSLPYGGANAKTLQITEVMSLLRDERLLLGSGMGLVVNVEHVLDGKLGIALGGGKALVAQHLLNGAQVGAFLQHVGSKGVAQCMRVNVRR